MLERVDRVQGDKMLRINSAFRRGKKGKERIRLCCTWQRQRVHQIAGASVLLPEPPPSTKQLIHRRNRSSQTHFANIISNNSTFACACAWNAVILFIRRLSEEVGAKGLRLNGLMIQVMNGSGWGLSSCAVIKQLLLIILARTAEDTHLLLWDS